MKAPIPNLRWIKAILSQPWVGPSISLVVLVVGLIALWFNLATYYRQGARWEAEEASKIQLQLHIQPELTADGFRLAYVQLYFPTTEPVRLDRLEFTDPPGVVVKVDPKVGTSEDGNVLVIDPHVGSSSKTGPSITIDVLIRTPRTPLDQNSVITVRADVSELTENMRHLGRATRAAIPSDAQK